ncbi:hypothetical protein DW159_01220 [Coprococcus sp. AM14-16]|uniref:hypothetical protein n=1 Tax=Coprococcus TaxID=33042 RepID=UPI000E408E21|nr:MULTISPECIES: hypothetical protein [Coprococcus]RGD40648.1 hypothetical protein DW159_01220 [Coprococcus sp. AM14-16]
MAQQTNFEKINFLVSHARANLNLCVAAYQIIEKTSIEDRPTLMETFIRGFKNTRTDESIEIPEVFNEETEHAYTRRYQRIVDGHLEEFLNAGFSKEDFYAELTNYIMTDKNLLDDGARAFAIFDCCIDKRLPYACVDLTSGMRMENEEYAACIEQLVEDIDRVNYILNANLQQKTERASLLLRELDSCDDFKKKTVLMATILNRYDADAIRKALLQIKLSSNPTLADLLSDD